MPSLSLRINLDPAGRIGPGKVELLERIATEGSISGGARAMGMSYKHAWDLVEEMNGIFGKPVVAAQKGGPKGGGAMLIDEEADPNETKNLIDDPKLAKVREELAALAKKHAGGAK